MMTEALRTKRVRNLSRMGGESPSSPSYTYYDPLSCPHQAVQGLNSSAVQFPNHTVMQLARTLSTLPL